MRSYRWEQFGTGLSKFSVNSEMCAWITKMCLVRLANPVESSTVGSGCRKSLNHRQAAI